MLCVTWYTFVSAARKIAEDPYLIAIWGSSVPYVIKQMITLYVQQSIFRAPPQKKLKKNVSLDCVYLYC